MNNTPNVTLIPLNDCDAYVCTCGNRADLDGFYACTDDGTDCEPDENWGGLYSCAACSALSRIVTVTPGDTVRLVDTDAVNAGDDPTGVVVSVTADSVTVNWTEYDTQGTHKHFDLTPA